MKIHLNFASLYLNDKLITMKKITILSVVVMLTMSIMGCSTVGNVANVIGSINLTDVETDKELGAQMYAQIQSDPTNYPLLSETKYAEAYKHIRRITNTILDCGAVANRDVFDWSVMIIDADDVQNAFACPGGKIYVYTGLVLYLDNEAELAGVIAHEIAHAATRHSTRQMQQTQGLDYVTSLLLGKNPGALASTVAQVAGNMGGLAFSRKDEYEADNLAVYYLSHTEYNPLGVAGFFEKLIAAGQAGEAGFATYFSTHPSPPDRVQQIYAAWEAYGSIKGDDFKSRYQQVKNTFKK